jgi:hypothetical protein
MNPVFYEISDATGQGLGLLTAQGGFDAQTWQLRSPGLRGALAGARFRARRVAGGDAPRALPAGPARTERLKREPLLTLEAVEQQLREGVGSAQRQLDPGAVTVWAGTQCLGSLLIAWKAPGVFLEAWSVGEDLWAGRLEAFSLKVEVCAHDLPSADKAIQAAQSSAQGHPARVLRCTVG